MKICKVNKDNKVIYRITTDVGRFDIVKSILEKSAHDMLLKSVLDAESVNSSLLKCSGKERKYL